MTQEKWNKTACILCSINCGLEVQVQDRHLQKIRGDKKNPLSQGYLCQKAARLDYYQNNSDLLEQPLRRKEDGCFEAISWETAFREIAAKLIELRDSHGGDSLAFYGGGGQGNHLGGLYSSALRAAMKTRYLYTALAQEKTGDFWVNGKLFGRQHSHITEDVEHADVAVFIGTNPWQAHGIPRARSVLREIAKDPQKTMIVIDPKETETAKLADMHVRVFPGRDVYLLSAIIAVIIQKGWYNQKFIEERTTGFEKLQQVFANISPEDYAEKSHVPLEQVVSVAQKLCEAKTACIRVDLGLQQSLNSTLNSYLEKLLFLITGNLGRRGTNNFHTLFAPLIGHSDEKKLLHSKITNTAEIGKLFPPNILPQEIDNNDPQRIRGLVVDSANPVVTGADTQE
ncbi:molybdopterin-dependent oxidoreductase [Candidatus Uabimicrobium amorphum]|uniref:Molybdopterin oxidoreductase n=1 Tax=Uabimicrobium amorphum TaxID=2596890 RepID=A0A5S9F259_UABAM|nr:molybdopterin-dependent oxidoreductase [Candidatus Uabimicrobium amorphum]BBM82773.1 molybdopterin oxidoreductase [Candidatus Uabimicrobium amorphum]